MLNAETDDRALLMAICESQFGKKSSIHFDVKDRLWTIKVTDTPNGRSQGDRANVSHASR
jgi:hypothetical protein